MGDYTEEAEILHSKHEMRTVSLKKDREELKLLYNALSTTLASDQIILAIFGVSG